MGASIGVSLDVKSGGRNVALTLAKKAAPASAIAFPCLCPMRVMRWADFKDQHLLLRSDEASRRGLLVDATMEEELCCIFISHSWWHRTDSLQAPDFTSGERAHLKYRNICAGVRSLIERDSLNESRLALWCDYYSIDQEDAALKSAGVQSMLHYTTECRYMLIPGMHAAVRSPDVPPRACVSVSCSPSQHCASPCRMGSSNGADSHRRLCRGRRPRGLRCILPGGHRRLSVASSHAQNSPSRQPRMRAPPISTHDHAAWDGGRSPSPPLSRLCICLADGRRGWCRIEYFIFGLASEMRRDSSAGGESLRLFAVGASGALQQFKVVEFLGGDRGDMPSQGDFSFEQDRAAIMALEDSMISAFGHAVIRNAAAEHEPVVDLGAKMLRDEHMPTLAQAVADGAFNETTTISFNACPLFSSLPDLTGMAALRTLTCINCTALRQLPDLSRLPSLQSVKLEACDQLQALPALPPSAHWVDAHLPEHLKPTARQ